MSQISLVGEDIPEQMIQVDWDYSTIDECKV